MATPLNPNSFPYYPSSTSNLVSYPYSDIYQQPSPYICYMNPLLSFPSSTYVATNPPYDQPHFYYDILHPWWTSPTVLSTIGNGYHSPDPPRLCHMTTLVDVVDRSGPEQKSSGGCNIVGLDQGSNIGKYSSYYCYVPSAEKNKKNKKTGYSSTISWMKKGFSRRTGAESSSTTKCCSSPNLRCFRKKSSVDKTSPEVYEFRAAVGNAMNSGGSGGGDIGLHGSRTTVMIKNVPNKYTKEMLLSLVDSHCAEINQNLRSCSMMYGENSEANPKAVVFSEFDFFYLPMDFSSGSNLGYAFVNFTSPVAAWRLYRALHNKRWPFLPSRKICQLTFARIQGLRALKRNFEDSKFNCKSDDLLPIEFHPPRNGTNTHVKGLYIGTRVARLLSDS